MALTDYGEIFSLGHNGHGQCGRDIVEEEDYLRNRGVIHRVKGPWEEKNNNKDEEVTQIVTGQDHRYEFSLTGLIMVTYP